MSTRSHLNKASSQSASFPVNLLQRKIKIVRERTQIKFKFHKSEFHFTFISIKNIIRKYVETLDMYSFKHGSLGGLHIFINLLTLPLFFFKYSSSFQYMFWRFFFPLQLNTDITHYNSKSWLRLKNQHFQCSLHCIYKHCKYISITYSEFVGSSLPLFFLRQGSKSNHQSSCTPW